MARTHNDRIAPVHACPARPPIDDQAQRAGTFAHCLRPAPKAVRFLVSAGQLGTTRALSQGAGDAVVEMQVPR